MIRNKKVILDTDLGCDSDDIGAIVILQNLAKSGLADIEAMTSVNSNLEPALVIDYINSYYQNTVPLGMNKSNDYGIKDGYALDICNKYHLPKKEFNSSNDVLINTLLNQDKVTLITIGPFTNIATLLKDELGRKLLNEKVDVMYSMAGNFVSNNPEWNVTEDIESAKFVLENYHGSLVFVPFEIGCDVFSARTLLASDTLMGYGYYIHNKGPRQSWDPITVYYAVTNSNLFKLSKKGTIKIDDKGVTTFTEGTGNHQYMLNDFDKKGVEKLLDEVMIP